MELVFMIHENTVPLKHVLLLDIRGIPCYTQLPADCSKFHSHKCVVSALLSALEKEDCYSSLTSMQFRIYC